MNKTTKFLPRLAKTIIPGCNTRQRRVYDICELKQTDERGIRYNGFVNIIMDGERYFTVVGATSLESGIWYDINIVGLREVIAQHESEVPHA